MQLREHVSVDFSRTGPEAHPCLAAWDAPVDGRRWADGVRSALDLPKPAVAGDLILLLTVDPFVFPPVLTRQTLRVLVNGRTVRLASVRARTVFACRIPAAVLALRDDAVGVTFEHPDATRPAMISASRDERAYSVAFVAASLQEVAGARPADRPAEAAGPEPEPDDDLTDAALMQRFISLGDNCEFGIAQRMCGAEPMGLLRFSAARMPGLLHGLEHGFGRMDEIEHVEFEVLGRPESLEYILHHRLYLIQSHVALYDPALPQRRLYARELTKIGLLARLFDADVAAGRHIFVFKRNDPTTLADVLPIWERLRARGPNTLLHVVCDGRREPGTVEVMRPGLMQATIDRFSPYDQAASPPSDVWRTICRRSYALWRSPEFCDMERV